MAAQPGADWGEPRPAEWVGPRETLTIRLPAALAEAIREEARLRGTSVSVVVTHLLEAALERRPVRAGARHADLVSTLFD